MTARFHRAGLWSIVFALSWAWHAGAWAGERYAFLVAVDDYERTGLRSLKYADRDVQELKAALLQGGYARERIVLLCQSSAAGPARFSPLGKNIREELGLLCERLHEDDSLLVAMSGHGVQFAGDTDAYFCPADANLSDRTSLVSLVALYRQLEDCRAATKVMLIDACRNDPESGSKSARKVVNLETLERRSIAVPPGGIAVLASCSAGQEAFEDAQLQHGVFFHYVIQGLKGHADFNPDGVVSLSELEEYLVTNVQRFATEKLGRKQVPERRGEARGQIALAAVSRSSAAKAPVQTLQPLNTSSKVPAPMPAIGGERPASGLPATIAPVERNTASLPGVENSIGMRLVLVRPGEFVMGTSARDPLDFKRDNASHAVRITKPFWLGVFEVTEAEYLRVMQDGSPVRTGNSDGRLPARNMTWYDGLEFCNRLSELEKLKPYYSLSEVSRSSGSDSIRRATVEIRGGNGYRLPTEAEWEYACRAGTATKWSFGDDESQCGDFAWCYAKGVREPCQVGQKQPNAFGLFDMHGNVWERCQDWYDQRYYQASPRDDPTGPARGETNVVIRGGSFRLGASYSASAFRESGNPDHRRDDVGFRIARSASEDRSQ